jgi:hypothetical protein
MNRTQLEHVLRACGSIAGCREIVVIVREMLRAGLVTEAAIRSLAPELSPDQGALLNIKLQICLHRP